MFHGLGVTTVVMAVRLARRSSVKYTLTESEQACFGVVLSTFKPQRPAAAMTPDAIFKAAMVTRSTYIFAVPIIIEVCRGRAFAARVLNWEQMWARDPNKVAALAQTKGVVSAIVPVYCLFSLTFNAQLYGGGPLNRAVGDHLTESGVDVYGTYGS
jgi:hypothetical protein